MQPSQGIAHNVETSTLVDVLERILDMGIVIAGDISIQLADIDLLRIRIRLVICSVDRAEAIGLDWWRRENPFAASKGQETSLLEPQTADTRLSALEAENKTLKAELAQLQQARMTEGD